MDVYLCAVHQYLSVINLVPSVYLKSVYYLITTLYIQLYRSLYFDISFN
jgi:hypothetical protein